MITDSKHWFWRVCEPESILRNVNEIVDKEIDVFFLAKWKMKHNVCICESVKQKKKQEKNKKREILHSMLLNEVHTTRLLLPNKKSVEQENFWRFLDPKYYLETIRYDSSKTVVVIINIDLVIDWLFAASSSDHLGTNKQTKKNLKLLETYTMWWCVWYNQTIFNQIYFQVVVLSRDFCLTDGC